MPETILFSVVILSYQSSKTWQAAVDSVLIQDYPRIELIYADDGSDDFDREGMERYIQQKAGSNLVCCQLLAAAQNRGTVRNLIEAEQKSTGEYLIHFAADDALANAHVLSDLAQALARKPQDVVGVYGKSIVCDTELNPMQACSFDTAAAAQMNQESAFQQWKRLCRRCCIHMGATAFVRTDLMQRLSFDDSFFLLEDWPFFLRATRDGGRFRFLDLPVLYYRQGGVTANAFSQSRKRLFRDHLHVYEKYILPQADLLGSGALKIWLRYLDDRMDARKAYGELSSLSYSQLSAFSRRFPAFFTVWGIKRYRKPLCVLLICVLFLWFLIM